MVPFMNASLADGRTNEAGRVYLIDASVYVFRAWFSLPDTMVDGDGQPINAVHGFARFLLDLRRRVERGSVLALAFDESLTSCFRNAIYPPYKANRPPVPEDLKRQFARCRSLCTALNLTTHADAQYEADDIIGHWTREARELGVPVTVVSRDKDLTQLVAADVDWWDFAGNVRLNADGVRQKMGVNPAQVADYLALTGDAVDNIPGVKGVGPKAAVALLARFVDLDALYRDIDAVPSLPVRGAAALQRRLVEGEASARLSRRLTGVQSTCPGTPRLPTMGLPGARLRHPAALESEGLGDTITALLRTAFGHPGHN